MPAGALELVLEFARADHTDDPFAFRFGSQAYLIPDPGGAGGYGRSELLWDADLLARLQAIRRPGRDPAQLQEIGELLRRFLAPAGWEALERSIADAVRQRRPVRLAVRSQAAELYTLPWELLTLRTTGQSLGGLPDALIRYEWPQTATVEQERLAAPGRVLVAWSAAGGPVPAAEHVAAIQRAAAAGGLEFDPAADVVAHASTGRLAAALAAAQRSGRPVVTLLVLCHGAARGQIFGLHFHGEAADDDPVIVDPARLQQLLAPHAGSLRVVVVAACDSGNGGEPGNRIGSVAQMLHRGGLAAVLASRYPLTVPGSTTLVDALVRALLAERATIDRAFLAARAALAADAASLDWASLQLYARAADGERAPFAAPPPPLVTEAPPAARARAWPRVLAAVGGLTAVGLLAALKLAGTADDEPAPEEVPAVSGPVAREVDVGATTGPAGTTSAPEPATTSGAPAADSKAPSEPPGVVKKRLEPTTRPVGTCPSGLQSYVSAVLGRREQLATLRLTAAADGSLTVGPGAPSDVAAEARGRLAAARPDRVKERGGAGLPCRFTFEWGP